MMEQKISFYTLGCRLNQSETAVVKNTFKVDGFKVVDFNQPADVVVINTCTVTENGDADTRRLVNKVNRLNPNAQIALIGCQAQVQKEKLTALPNVRWVVGNERKMDLLNVLNETKNATTPQVITPTIERKPFTIPVAGIDELHTRVNIKIQDGCDFFCTFCEIPYARGRARSRVFNDILKEAKSLIASGHKELVITGINVGTYKEENHEILDVINALEDYEGLERIRISSIEPTTIADDIITKMGTQSKLCRHLHIPLQSGDDTILKDMKRKYSVCEFSEFIEKAHQQVDDICIGTDVIVGYPGETDQQFENTYSLLKDLPIDYFHVFSYSPRYMAKTQNYTNTIDIKTIQHRSKILRDLSTRKRACFYNQLLGSIVPILFEQEKNGYWTGLTDHYARVYVKSNHNLQNQIRNVKLENIGEKGIIGSLIYVK